MALKITEVNGKLVAEGNINSVTRQFLKQHIDIVERSTLFRNNHANTEEKYRIGSNVSFYS